VRGGTGKGANLSLFGGANMALRSGRTNRLRLSFPALFTHSVRELALSGLRFFVTFFWHGKESKDKK